MDLDDIRFVISDDKQHLFSQLINQTLGIPHGRFPTQQEDEMGVVWEFMVPVSRFLAARILLEASSESEIVPELLDYYRRTFLPGDKSFLIFSGNDTYLWSLYQSDDRFYIMRAEGKRYYHLLLRGRYVYSGADAEVYQTLHQLYGNNETSDTCPNLPVSEAG